MTLGKAGVAGDGPDTFNMPSDIVVAPNGDIFVGDGHGGKSNARVVKFTKDGKFIKAWGKREGTLQASSSRPTRWPWTPAAGCLWATRATAGSRSSIRTESFSKSGSNSAGRAGCSSTRTTVIYAADSQSDEKTNPGFKRGIRIGSAKDGRVTAFIVETDADGSQEGVTADAKGNVYGSLTRGMAIRKFATNSWRDSVAASRPRRASSQTHALTIEGEHMESKARLVVMLCLLCAVTAYVQGQEAPLPPPATDTVAPDIPGIVKGGSKVQVIVDGLQHTDGPATMPDGTLLYWDFMARRLGKVDPNGKPGTFLSNTDGSSAIGFDSKGRLITTIKPQGQECQSRGDLAQGERNHSGRQHRRQTLRGPERSRRRQAGRRLLHPLRKGHRPLRPSRREGDQRLRGPQRADQRRHAQHRREDALRRHSEPGSQDEAVDCRPPQGRRRVSAGVRRPARRNRDATSATSPSSRP